MKSEIQEQYEIERELAERLRAASREERILLYSSLYDELFRRVPYHSLLKQKQSSALTATKIHLQFDILKSLLGPDTVFAEIGAGDCSLSHAVAKIVKKVYALEVSAIIAGHDNAPDNFELVIFDGCNIPLPDDSVDVAYSNHVMEHLHPDDALDQLKSIYRTVRPDGMYVLRTPNRLTGPHDISKHFDRIATCFHLKEYTNTELFGLLRAAGFSKVQRCRFPVPALGGRYVTVPVLVVKVFECLFSMMPFWFRRKAAGLRPVRKILDIELMAKK